MNNNILLADTEAAVKKRTAKGIALAYLGFTSMLVTFPYGYQLASNVFPSWLAWLPAAVVSILIYRFIDGDLADSLTYREKTTGKARSTFAQRRRKTAKIAIAFLLLATVSVTFVANYLVADKAIEKKDTSELVEAKEGINRQYSDKTDKLEAYLSEMKRDLSEAARQGHKVVESARWASNPAWGKRFGPHLAYAETQKAKGKLLGAFATWYANVRQAQADSAALVRQAQGNLSEAKSNLSAHLSVRQDSIGKSVETAFLSEVVRAEGLYNKFASFLLLTDIVAAIVILFNHSWLCLFYRDNGTVPESKHSWQLHIDKWTAETSDRLKGRIFPADLSGIKEAIIEPPHAPDKARPGMVPVRATGGGDAWELDRRQKLVEAKIEEAERRQAEVLRQKEQEARQAQERADKLAAEKAEVLRQKQEAEARARQIEADRSKPKPVSDKDSSEVSAKVVGNTVEFDGNSYNLSELSKFVEYAAKCYNRQLTLATDKGRRRNKDRWEAAKPVLEKLGYNIEYRDGNKVSITGGKTIKA